MHYRERESLSTGNHVSNCALPAGGAAATPDGENTGLCLMSKLVTIYGGSGFVGRYVAQRMARQGWRVRVAVRRPNEAMFVKP